MRILGIDPGVERVGIAVITFEGGRYALEECGVITTPASLSMPERLHMIRNDIKTYCTTKKLDAAGVEELFFAKNVTTALDVSQARGVILEVLHTLNIPSIAVKPVQVKAAVAGHGDASKAEVQKMVQLTFKLDKPPKPDDAADAVAIAMTAAGLVPSLSSNA